MEHVTRVENTKQGYLARCTCGWRALEFASEHKATEFCDTHERDAKYLRLNSRSRGTNKTWATFCRENSENPVFSFEERAQWKALAEEMEAELHLQRKNPVFEGQETLTFE